MTTALRDDVIINKEEMAELLHAARFGTDTEALDLLLSCIWNRGKIRPTHVFWPDPLWQEVQRIDLPEPSPLFRAERSVYEQLLARASVKQESIPGTLTLTVAGKGTTVFTVEPFEGFRTGDMRPILTLNNPDEPPRRYRVTQMTPTQYQIEH